MNRSFGITVALALLLLAGYVSPVLTLANKAVQQDQLMLANVPEPAALLLLAVGLLGMARFSRRRLTAPR